MLRRSHKTSAMKVFQIIALSALAVVLLTSTAGRLTSSLSFQSYVISTLSVSSLAVLASMNCHGQCGYLLTVTHMSCRGTGMRRSWHQPEQCMRFLLKCHQGQCYKDSTSSVL